MKTIYKQPDCEILSQSMLAILCISNDAAIDPLTSGSVDDGDYEPIY